MRGWLQSSLNFNNSELVWPTDSFINADIKNHVHCGYRLKLKLEVPRFSSNFEREMLKLTESKNKFCKFATHVTHAHVHRIKLLQEMQV